MAYPSVSLSLSLSLPLSPSLSLSLPPSPSSPQQPKEQSVWQFEIEREQASSQRSPVHRQFQH